MKHNVNVENILKFEKDYQLKEREIYGVNYWYCRRTRTLNDIIATANKQQDMCDKEEIKEIRIFSRKNFIGKNNRNIDILLITDARRIKQGYNYESIYTDEIEKANNQDNFINLIESFKKNGFNNKYPVELNKKFEIFEGSHRLACSIYFGIEEIPVTFNKDFWELTYDYSLRWFENNGMDEYIPFIKDRYNKIFM